MKRWNKIEPLRGAAGLIPWRQIETSRGRGISSERVLRVAPKIGLAFATKMLREVIDSSLAAEDHISEGERANNAITDVAGIRVGQITDA